MKNKAKHSERPEPDAYMALIHRFPLKPIRSDAEHERAIEIIAELIGRKLDSGTSDYLDKLIFPTNEYEDEHHTPGGVDLSPRQALKAIRNVNGLSQAQLGKIIGSESAVSMFFKGERELSKAHIKAIAARFHVDAGLFL